MCVRVLLGQGYRNYMTDLFGVSNSFAWNEYGISVFPFCHEESVLPNCFHAQLHVTPACKKVMSVVQLIKQENTTQTHLVPFKLERPYVFTAVFHTVSSSS